MRWVPIFLVGPLISMAIAGCVGDPLDSAQPKTFTIPSLVEGEEAAYKSCFPEKGTYSLQVHDTDSRMNRWGEPRDHVIIQADGYLEDLGRLAGISDFESSIATDRSTGEVSHFMSEEKGGDSWITLYTSELSGLTAFPVLLMLLAQDNTLEKGKPETIEAYGSELEYTYTGAMAGLDFVHVMFSFDARRDPIDDWDTYTFEFDFGLVPDSPLPEHVEQVAGPPLCLTEHGPFDVESEFLWVDRTSRSSGQTQIGRSSASDFEAPNYSMRPWGEFPMDGDGLRFPLSSALDTAREMDPHFDSYIESSVDPLLTNAVYQPSADGDDNLFQWSLIYSDLDSGTYGQKTEVGRYDGPITVDYDIPPVTPIMAPGRVYSFLWGQRDMLPALSLPAADGAQLAQKYLDEDLDVYSYDIPMIPPIQIRMSEDVPAFGHGTPEYVVWTAARYEPIQDSSDPDTLILRGASASGLNGQFLLDFRLETSLLDEVDPSSSRPSSSQVSGPAVDLIKAWNHHSGFMDSPDILDY